MPRRVIGAFVALMVIAACSGDDEDAAPATTTATRASTTTTTSPPRLDDRSGNPFPQSRTIELRGVTLAPGESVGFATHPNDAMTFVTASSEQLELCPATTDGEVALKGFWPGDAHFDSCRPPADGVPSPGSGFHVGWAIRATGSAVVTFDATISYVANDGFFLWRPASTCGDLVVTPRASDIVGVGTGGVLTQDGATVPLVPEDGADYLAGVGRVRVEQELTISCATPRADAPGIIVDWA